MARIAVVTDSTADFADGERERWAIEVIPLSVTWDGEVFRDKVDLTTAAFYQRLGTRQTAPQTASPPPGEFEETYERLLGSADHVVSVHLASSLSGTYGVARAAADRVAPDRISVIDSSNTGLGLGWLATRAAELGGTAPIAAVEAELQRMIRGLRLYAVLDTMEYLRRGGRIGRAQAFIGALLNFKPMLLVREGQVYPVERPRSRAVAMRRVVDVVASAGNVERVGVVHGGAPEVLDQLQPLLEERLPGRTVDRAEIGIVLGTHAGPSAFGVACLVSTS